jgi:outer membrane protein TolC
MNRLARPCLPYVVCVVLVVPSPVHAEESIDERWVIGTLKKSNPSLKAAAIELEQSREETRLQEGKFPYVLQADGSYTRLKAPQLASDGTVTSQGQDLLLGTQLSHTFVTGSIASVRLEGQYSNGPSSLCSGLASSPDCYQATLRASLTQPLLRGFGETVNLAGLRAARISEQKQSKVFDRQSSTLVRDALLGYWELYYASKAVDIQQAALDVAKAQQREADQRVEHGQLAAADALKFRTQVASLTESLINAQAALSTGSVELARLVGAPVASWIPVDSEPAVDSLPARRTVIDRLREQSPALAEKTEALRLARERRRSAGDEYRARLDASTWIETGGPGTTDAARAFRQTGSMGTISVYAGLTFQKALDEKQLRAARSQAAQAEALAEADLAVTAQQLESTAIATLQKAEQASALHAAATVTLEVAIQQAENERQRFHAGANTYLDVQVAEDTLRQARLRVVRASVDQIKARITLNDITGDLVASKL